MPRGHRCLRVCNRKPQAFRNLKALPLGKSKESLNSLGSHFANLGAEHGGTGPRATGCVFVLYPNFATSTPNTLAAAALSPRQAWRTKSTYCFSCPAR